MQENCLCDWKMVPLKDYKLGIPSPRCGEPATVKVVRADRKKDLYLCTPHLDVFVAVYGNTLPIEEVCQDESS